MTERVRVEGRRLGRLPSPPEKLRTALQADDYITKLAGPPAYDWAKAMPEGWIKMYLNDQEGDCTCASQAHFFGVVGLIASGSPTFFNDVEVQALYDLVNGGQDQGANMIDVLHQLRAGPGLGGHKILAYVKVDPSNRPLVRTAAWLFGGLYVGISLPTTAQHQTTWDYVSGTAGNEPGSWGGHAVYVPAYDRHGLTVPTWNEKLRMTWSFWQHYVDEVWAMIPQDYDALHDKPIADLGVNEQQLLADLQHFGPANP